MKMLLTSGGVTNESIRKSLIGLIGKEPQSSRALCIPTAQWAHPYCSPESVRNLIAATPDFKYFTGIEWASLGVLELTALPTIGIERWRPWVESADVILADGGDATYLCHWMRQSGFVDLLPALKDKVWVGVSAGSMVMTPRIGTYFVEWSQAPNDRCLGQVDFSIFPHLNAFPTNTILAAEKWAKEIGIPAYAIDEQTAIQVVDAKVEVISEGYWREFNA